MLVINSTNTSICNVKHFYIEKILSQDTASSPTWFFFRTRMIFQRGKTTGKKKNHQKTAKEFPIWNHNLHFFPPSTFINRKKKGIANNCLSDVQPRRHPFSSVRDLSPNFVVSVCSSEPQGKTAESSGCVYSIKCKKTSNATFSTLS